MKEKPPESQPPHPHEVTPAEEDSHIEPPLADRLFQAVQQIDADTLIPRPEKTRPNNS